MNNNVPRLGAHTANACKAAVLWLQGEIVQMTTKKVDQEALRTFTPSHVVRIKFRLYKAEDEFDSCCLI